MNIRSATLDDVPRLVEMSSRFLRESVYGTLFNPSPSQIKSIVAVVLDLGIALVGEVDKRPVGMIGLVDVPHPVTGDRCAQEVAWWVDPEHRQGSIGPRLIVAAELWAVRRGLPAIWLAAPHQNEDVGAWLSRRGYRAVETSYVKLMPES